MNRIRYASPAMRAHIGGLQPAQWFAYGAVTEMIKGAAANDSACIVT